MLNYISFNSFFLRIVILIILGLLIYSIPSIFPIYRKISKKVWLILLTIVLLNLFIKVNYITPKPIVYYDEYEHMNTAQNIAYSNLACRTTFGSIKEINNCEIPQHPPGYPSLLSFSYMIFGDDPQVSYSTNSFLNSLGIIIIFLLIFLIFSRTDLALLASLFYSGIPLFFRYSGSSAIEVSASFFLLFSIFLWELFSRKKEYRLFLLALSSTLFMIYTRPEMILSIPAFIYIVLVRLDKKRSILEEHKFIVVFFIFILLLNPFLFIINNSVSNYKTEGWNFDFQDKILNFSKSIGDNLLFLVNPKINSLILSIMFISALIYFLYNLIINYKSRHNPKYHTSLSRIIRYHFRKILPHLFFSEKGFFLIYISLLFFPFFILYTAHSTGNLNTLEYSTNRYSLILFPSIILASIFFIYSFFNNYFNDNSKNSFNDSLKDVNKNKIKILLIIISILFIFSLYPSKGVLSFDSIEVDNLHDFYLKGKEFTDKDYYVASFNPSGPLSIGYNKSIKTSFIVSYQEFLSNESIYLMKDYWWHNFRFENSTFEQELESNYFMTEIFSYGKYSIIEMKPKKELSFDIDWTYYLNSS
jgi:4-amino-4-deoxy-L-arabinose transferase-like glycosyltransferase